MEKKINKREGMSYSVKKALNMMLKLEADSASCTVLYEPKMPEELSKFKRKN